MEIRVKVDLDNAKGDGSAELVNRRARATMEDKEDRLIILGSEFLADKGLVLPEKLGVKLDVA